MILPTILKIQIKMCQILLSSYKKLSISRFSPSFGYNIILKPHNTISPFIINSGLLN